VQGFLEGLKADSSDLDDIQRDIMIQATFKVAAADGVIMVGVLIQLKQTNFPEHALLSLYVPRLAGT
jgi:hypothetical protein